MLTKYADVRKQMRSGDLLAFGGKGGISDWIKFFTGSAVSHVGAVLRRTVIDLPDDRYFVEMIESTSLNGQSGVMVNRLSDRLRDYDGEVWWLPLAGGTRVRMDLAAYMEFMFASEGKPYDARQAIGAGVNLLDWAGVENTEDFAKMFCSELVTGALEASGAVPTMNASEVIPIEMCRWNIYEGCYQISGEPQIIRGFNTLSLG